MTNMNVHGLQPQSQVVIILNSFDMNGDKQYWTGCGQDTTPYKSSAHTMTFQQAVNSGWNLTQIFPA